MYEKQQGKCAICGTMKPGKRAKHLCVDHDHETDKVRALLCVSCNNKLGILEDKEFCRLANLYLQTYAKGIK